MVIRLPRKYDVTVLGKDCEVKVYQKHKTVWCAVGYYGTERIETKGSSESSALRAWEEKADYFGGRCCGSAADRRALESRLPQAPKRLSRTDNHK